MPSVRVRRSDNYLRISDSDRSTNDERPPLAGGSGSTRQRPRSRTLSCVFGDDNLPGGSNRLQATRVQTQAQRDADARSHVSSNAETSSIKTKQLQQIDEDAQLQVDSPVTGRGSRSLSRSRQGSNPQSGPSSPERAGEGGQTFIASQAPQMELLIPAHRQPGLVESTLS